MEIRNNVGLRIERRFIHLSASKKSRSVAVQEIRKIAPVQIFVQNYHNLSPCKKDQHARPC